MVERVVLFLFRWVSSQPEFPVANASLIAAVGTILYMGFSPGIVGIVLIVYAGILATRGAFQALFQGRPSPPEHEHCHFRPEGDGVTLTCYDEPRSSQAVMQGTRKEVLQHRFGQGPLLENIEFACGVTGEDPHLGWRCRIQKKQGMAEGAAKRA